MKFTRTISSTVLELVYELLRAPVSKFLYALFFTNAKTHIFISTNASVGEKRE